MRAKIRLRRPSMHRRCTDEMAVKFPCRTPKYPADGNRGTCRGIFVGEKGQDHRGESLSACGKFPNSHSFLAKPYYRKTGRLANRKYARWSPGFLPLLWSFEATPVFLLPPYRRHSEAKKCCRSSTFSFKYSNNSNKYSFSTIP